MLSSVANRQTVLSYTLVIGAYAIVDKLFGSIWVAFMSLRQLSDMEIGMVLAVTAAALVLFDYPSGTIADVFGRKRTMSVGFVIWGLATLLFSFTMGFWWFAVALIIWAAGTSLISGAPQAWLVDRLAASGDDQLHRRVLPIAGGASLAVGALAAAGAGGLSTVAVAAPLVVSGSIAVLAGIVISLTLPESFGQRDVRLSHALQIITRILAAPESRPVPTSITTAPTVKPAMPCCVMINPMAAAIGPWPTIDT